jgi:hypothetical protein
MADLRVFGKTAKGTAEIAARSGGLSLAQRRLLILVDGARSVDQLAGFVTSGLAESLQALEGGGYVELVGERSGDADDEAFVPPPSSIPESEMTSVEEARSRAARALHDLLGPVADDLAIAIEAAKDGDQLRPLIREAERLIASAHGQATAQAFIQGIRRR